MNGGNNGEGEAIVRIGDESIVVVPDVPLVFGRADATGVLGLNHSDMGVSAVAGSLEYQWGVWWIVNQSTKRQLLIEGQAGATPVALSCGHRHAIMTERITVLVPGAVYTYAVEVLLPAGYAANQRWGGPASTGTLIPGAEVDLSERDRTALAALFAGYLEPWPHRREQPNSYADASRLAGGDWTEIRLRKQIERLRERYRARGMYFEGERAREELAAHVIGNGLLTGEHLALLQGRD